jgi:hypothetical protein
MAGIWRNCSEGFNRDALMFVYNSVKTITEISTIFAIIYEFMVTFQGHILLLEV